VLKGVPAAARVLVAGELPEAARKNLTGKTSPLRVVPKQFVFHATQAEKMNFEANGTLKDKDEAQAFIDGILGLKQLGLKELDNIPAEAKVPPELIKRAKEALNALKVETDGATAKLKASLDSAAILGDLLMMLMRSSEPAQPPER